jgi:hypothetical protein
MFPDLDNKNEGAFLRMIPRMTWGDLFNEWLQHPHRKEFEGIKNDLEDNTKV